MTTASIPVRPTPRRAVAPLTGRVLIVSNRLPVTVSMGPGGADLRPSAGGLATGLRTVHAPSRGLWIGWLGGTAAIEPRTRRALDRRLARLGAAPVPLTPDEVAGFYDGFSNGLLWPVLHDLGDRAAVAARQWDAYRAVNARFADRVAAHWRPGDTIWVHDYQLMLVPRLVRERCPGARVGFFLHTPFPAPQTFASLPQAGVLLDGLLGADLIGFHTAEYARRFEAATAATSAGHAQPGEVVAGGRRTHVRTHPMGIDAAAFAARSADSLPSRAAARRWRLGDEYLFVGVDRLDYTKGIPHRLLAFERLLAEHPELRGRTRLVQLAVPSREEVPAYRALRAEVEGLVARINDALGTAGWVPVEYIYGSVDDATLVSLYRAADIMLVTPLRDGMNLVAKEFVATRGDGGAALVLSRFAGAAAELGDAVLVDPTDIAGTAAAYHAALTMPPGERWIRMRRMRRLVMGNDVFRWADRFLEDLASCGRP